jgi:hypothetical protein
MAASSHADGGLTIAPAVAAVVAPASVRSTRLLVEPSGAASASTADLPPDHRRRAAP